MMTPRAGGLLAFLVLAASLPGCEGTDQALVVDIGNTQVVVVDSGVAQQTLVNPETKIQSSDCSVSVAQATYPGIPEPPIDLLFGGTCRMVDTSQTLFLDGPCSGGVVIDSTDGKVPLTLRVVFTMVARRARPVVLSPGADTDGDGILDDGDFSGSAFDNRCVGGATTACDDNCPLLPNADQADSYGSGIGDRCAQVGVSFINPDNDGDSVSDGADNCVWSFNPDQTNTTGLAAEGIPDGIGDACEEQQATVLDASTMSTTIELERTINLRQPFRQSTFLTVDVNSDQSMTCDWDVGTCRIDTARILLCVVRDPSLIRLGCG